MTGRGRGGRHGRGGRGWGGRSRGGGGAPTVRSGRDVCTCEANAPLLVELRNLEEECVRTGKQNLKCGVMRAIKSIKLYPLPVTTETEACALEGVGSFTARRMLRGLPQPPANNTAPACGARDSGAPSVRGSRRLDEENIEPPWDASSPTGKEKHSSRPSAARQPPGGGLAAGACSTADNRNNAAFCSGSGSDNGRSFSLAANFSALRGEDDDDGAGSPQTPDITPRRPASRARTGDGGFGMAPSAAPPYFDGPWEAVLLVDNREHEFLSVQSALLQKGVKCETRQLPLGDMLWVAKRNNEPASEVLLGYIVERKTAPDLASSIVDGRYEEQKRRLKRSGLRRCIYLVEGNLSHQNQLPPSALRTALASSQACTGLAVVRCASLRDTIDYLARTHRHVASLLHGACFSSGKRFPEIDPSGNEQPSGRNGGAILRPAMTYGEYAQGCAKRASSTTTRQVLGAMLRQVPGCSAARAEAIVREFESPLAFLLALERVAGAGSDTERMKRAEDVLSVLRCRGGAGTNKLPQPLKRLLCQLFLGEGGSPAGSGGVLSGPTAAGMGGGRWVGEGSYRSGVAPMSQDDMYCWQG